MVPTTLMAAAITAKKTEQTLVSAASTSDLLEMYSDSRFARKVPQTLFLERPKLPPASKDGMYSRARTAYGRSRPNRWLSIHSIDSDEFHKLGAGGRIQNKLTKQDSKESCAQGVRDLLKKRGNKSLRLTLKSGPSGLESEVIKGPPESEVSSPGATRMSRHSLKTLGRISRATLSTFNSTRISKATTRNSEVMPEVLSHRGPELADDGFSDQEDSGDETTGNHVRGKAYSQVSDSMSHKRSSLEQATPSRQQHATKFSRKRTESGLQMMIKEQKPRHSEKILQRMSRLDHVRAERLKQMRARNRHDLKWKRFNQLPKKEREALSEGFARFDMDRSGYLDHGEVIACLREFGLCGATPQEKREILAICLEATMSDEDDSEHVKSPEEVEIDLLDLALTVVPCVRQVLIELRGDELLKQFFKFDEDGSGKLSQKEMKELARGMGLDPRSMDVGSNIGDDAEVDFETFQDMIIRGREKLERTCREKERAVQKTAGLSESAFQQYRKDLVPLHDVYVRYDRDGSGSLNKSELVSMLQESGMAPRSQQEKEDMAEIFREPDDDALSDDEISFGDFLDIVYEIRRYRINKVAEVQLDRFNKYDRDKSGVLNAGEISRLLEDMNLTPMNRIEQEEIANLISSVDMDGSGFIDFSEFQELSQRIDEKLTSFRYEEEIEFAMCLGFTEQQMRDVRQVFTQLDADGSQKLDTDEVRIGLAMMNKNVTHKVFEETFRSLDTDGSGELDFLEFLHFMKLIIESQGFTEGREESQKLAPKPKDLDTRILRRVLEYFRLAKHYIQSLGHDDLVGLFCEYFTVKPEQNLHTALEVKTVGELYKLAQDRDAAMQSDIN